MTRSPRRRSHRLRESRRTIRRTRRGLFAFALIERGRLISGVAQASFAHASSKSNGAA